MQERSGGGAAEYRARRAGRGRNIRTAAGPGRRPRPAIRAGGKPWAAAWPRREPADRGYGWCRVSAWRDRASRARVATVAAIRRSSR